MPSPLYAPDAVVDHALNGVIRERTIQYDRYPAFLFHVERFINARLGQIVFYPLLIHLHVDDFDGLCGVRFPVHLSIGRRLVDGSPHGV